MLKFRFVHGSLLIALIFTACISLGLMITCKNADAETGQGLVGAWLVSASRAGGKGVVLLTFSSDGTFFRSGDTHPTLSVAHGSWKRINDREFDATYVALRFDENRKFVGIQKTRIRVTQAPGENAFTGLAKVSILDQDGKVERTSETQLEGKRIQVEPF